MTRCLMALACVLLTGCESTPPASTAVPSVSAGGDALAYAGCLREQGLHVADPPPGESVDLRDADQAGREKVEKAMTACRALAPPRSADRGAAGQDTIDGMLAYATCMRDKGLEWPDPTLVDGDARWPQGENLPSRTDPTFKAADETCRPLLGGKTGGTK
ncbi:hypothetical protein [Nonomuraea endophytica]|uniref:hypothetical protein n=1 Tax=Nonomuraea endophytica TaxID=714136 RepID=UPI0037C7B454